MLGLAWAEPGVPGVADETFAAVGAAFELVHPTSNKVAAAKATMSRLANLSTLASLD